MAIRDLSEYKTLEEKTRQLEEENLALKITLKERYRFGLLVGKSPVMRAIYEEIAQAAASDFSVFISGESGTGKELAARMIHQLSERRDNAFVAINCGAIQDTLFEREFFGHRKGSFTGADRHAGGYFESAQGGTLFLDEVAELQLDQQVKLLRVLHDKKYFPIGSNQPKTADVRIIAATNKDFKKLQAQGLIRDDFFYRIHVITLQMPPLRERLEDIPLLIDHFLQRYSTKGEHQRLPAHILDAFLKYTWPGNIRELENALQRYLTTRQLEFTDSALLNEIELQQEFGLKLSETIEALEKRYILKALERTHGHRGKTAKLLGIDRKTLYQKIKKFQLEAAE